MLIPKISVGVNRKRSRSNFSFDSQTTANIGFVQPTMARLLPPDSSINVKQRTLVRMSPLVNPTFGRLSQRDYFTFVKMSDVYHPWAEFLSGKSYTPSDGDTYIPTDLPRFLLSDIVVLFMMSNSYMSIAIGDDPNMVIAGSNYVGDEEGFDDDIWPRYLAPLNNYMFFNGNRASELYPSGIKYVPCEEGKYFEPFSGSVFVSDSVQGSIFAQSLAGNDKEISKGVELVTFENCDFSYYITPEEIQNWSQNMPSFHYLNNKGQETVYNPSVNGLYINFRLKPFAKNIRKIFLGLGLSWNPFDSIYYNPFKLIAFYKSWFDSFVPARNIQFTDTRCYKLIQMLEKQRTTLQVTQYIREWISYEFPDAFYYYTAPDYFSASLYNLGDNSLESTQENQISFPYDGDILEYNSNLVKSNLKENAEFGSTNGLNTLAFIDRSSGASGQFQPVRANQSLGTSTLGGTPLNRKADIDNFFNLNGLTLQVALKLVRFTNKNNVIGRSIRDYLRVNYGIQDADTLVKITNKINSNRVDINFDDVMNLSESDNAFLGEYAGKGIGYKEAERTYFDTKDFGFFFCMSVIVPESGYYQGSLKEDTLYNKFDFFTEAFDALGYEVIRRGEILNEAITNKNHDFDTSQGFGFIPRYSYAKVAKNIINGDLSLHSTKNGLEGYYLDKKFPTYKVKTESYLDLQSAEVIRTDLVAPDFLPEVVSDSIRKIDPTDTIGDYNRIFQYRDIDLDHFIIQKVFDCEIKAPWKSLSDSFDTFDSDDNASVEINHS